MYLTHRVLAPACLLRYTSTEFSLSLSPIDPNVQGWSSAQIDLKLISHCSTALSLLLVPEEHTKEIGSSFRTSG